MAGTVSGGDVGRYVYCALNWKLARDGAAGAGGEAGIQKHGAVAERVDALELYQRNERQTALAAFYFALFAISTAALGVELFALDQRTITWWTLVFSSVLWMAGSLYLLVFHFYYRARAQDVVRSTKIEPGNVVFADSARHIEVLSSKVMPLQGRPDYVVERDGAMVPVELKTGKTPKAPYDSHTLQLAAYCYLVTEKFGKRTPYGILSYPERSFEIPYTVDLENRLLRTLAKIELATRIGEAHRDHENPRRCLGCSRRAGCPERLA